MPFVAKSTLKKRCAWAGTDSLYIEYHDKEWGVPVHNDRKLFEMLTLEGAQAGLSWITILKKRKNYKKAFAGFEPKKIVKFNRRKVKELLGNPGIVRNRLKIDSTISNAKAFLNVQREYGSFNRYIWQFTGYKTLKNGRKSMSQLPARTKESDAMSKDLKKRGFRFVGSTICYAFMQATGMVHDHIKGCFRHGKAIQN